MKMVTFNRRTVLILMICLLCILWCVYKYNSFGKSEARPYFLPISSMFSFKTTDWVFHTGRVCHVWCNFQPGYTCRTAIIFGTLKDSNLTINSLPVNICFSYRKRLAKWRSRFVKNGLKKSVFGQKVQNFVHFSHTVCSNFASMWSKNVSKNLWRNFRRPVSTFATIAGNSFKGTIGVSRVCHV